MNYHDPNAKPSQQPPQGSSQPWQPQQPPPPPQQWPAQPYTSPSQWQQPSQPWPPMRQPPPQRKPRTWLWIVAGIAVLSLCSTALGNAISQNSAATTASAGTVATSITATPLHYPPKTLADLRGLAAKGDASAIHEFSSESVGLTGVCPQPKRDTTISPDLTGQQFAEDLLAYFYGQGLDSPCGSVVFVEHSQSDAGNGYTAGRIYFDATDTSGQENTDPNASNLKYTLTLDIGNGLDPNEKEYTVTY